MKNKSFVHSVDRKTHVLVWPDLRFHSKTEIRRGLTDDGIELQWLSAIAGQLIMRDSGEMVGFFLRVE